MQGKSLAIGLKTSFQPVTGGDHAMSVHLRLLAEHASEALAEHEAARMVSEAERIKRICHGS